MCGSNNCKKFGTYFHEKDDCCDLPETLAIPEPLPLIPAGVPLEPPAGDIIMCQYQCDMCHVQVRDVLAGIITVRGAALLRPLVTRARVTVTGLVMAVTMTGTEAARVT